MCIRDRAVGAGSFLCGAAGEARLDAGRAAADRIDALAALALRVGLTGGAVVLGRHADTALAERPRRAVGARDAGRAADRGRPRALAEERRAVLEGRRRAGAGAVALVRGPEEDAAAERRRALGARRVN